MKYIFQVLNATGIFIQPEICSNYQSKKLDLILEIDKLSKELKSLDLVLSNQELDINDGRSEIQGLFSDVLSTLSILSGLHWCLIKGEAFSVRPMRASS